MRTIKELIEILRHARNNKETVIFNFKDEELHYTHRTWITIDEAKK